jgi:hypothetical protein
MKDIINQIQHFRPELQGLLECDVEISITTSNNQFLLPRVVDKTVEIHKTTFTNTVAIAIEIAYALQATVLIRHLPEKRLACYLVALQFAFKYMNTFSKAERNSYKAFLSEHSVKKYAVLQDYEALCDASPEKQAQCLGTYLVKQYFPNEKVNQLNEAIHFAVLAWPLACPTHILLTQGGDDRLLLSSDTSTNKYYVAPFPMNDVIVRSSCTASPPTVSGFIAAELLRQKLLIAALKKELPTTFAMNMKNIRNRITVSFKLKESEVFVVCTPSGTDAEILITYLALCRAKEKQLNREQTDATDVPLIQNIIVATNEVGSGTVVACKGQHFSSLTPDGNQIVVENGIEGLEDSNVEIITLSARKKNGVVNEICSSWEQIEEQVRCAIEGNKKIVVLHQVERSKTGIKVLCFSFLKRLKMKYQDTLIIVIDAAQMRCNESFLSDYLNAGFYVLGTGSKFFSGAPFSGVLLFPTKEAVLSYEDFADGLSYYFATDEVDERLTTLKKALPTRRNYGLLLRWETALTNIEQYVSIPFEKRVSIISWWLEKTKKLVEETAFVELFSEDINKIEKQNHDCWHDFNTIVLFTVHPMQEENAEPGLALDTKALKKVYQWMTKDIAIWLPNHASVEERVIANYKCLIGQPVKISEEPKMGVLRIALSAPMIYRMAEGKHIADVETRITRELEDERRVLKKLSLISKYYYHLLQNIKNAKQDNC